MGMFGLRRSPKDCWNCPLESDADIVGVPVFSMRGDPAISIKGDPAGTPRALGSIALGVPTAALLANFLLRCARSPRMPLRYFLAKWMSPGSSSLCFNVSSILATIVSDLKWGHVRPCPKCASPQSPQCSTPASFKRQ